MLMDFELHTKVNEVIQNLVREAKEEFNADLDLLVVQDDKYRNSEYEEIVYGIGRTKGMKKEEYYFNAIKFSEFTREFKIADKYQDEPVSYYEHIGTGFAGYISYRISVNTFNRIIKVYEVGYVRENGETVPSYHAINTIDMGKSKFAKKVIAGSKSCYA